MDLNLLRGRGLPLLMLAGTLIVPLGALAITPEPGEPPIIVNVDVGDLGVLTSPSEWNAELITVEITHPQTNRFSLPDPSFRLEVEPGAGEPPTDEGSYTPEGGAGGFAVTSSALGEGGSSPVAPVSLPEPSSSLLVAFGAAGLALLRRRSTS